MLSDPELQNLATPQIRDWLASRNIPPAIWRIVHKCFKSHPKHGKANWTLRLSECGFGDDEVEELEGLLVKGPVEQRAVCRDGTLHTTPRSSLVHAHYDHGPQRAEDLSQEIRQAQQEYHRTAQDTASKHHRTLGWTKSQLFIGGKLIRQRRGPNVWNAFVRTRLNAANADLPAGSRWKLKDFVKLHSMTLCKEYANLSLGKHTTLREGLSGVRLTRTRIICASPKAIQQDADATFQAMENEWVAICSRTAMQGFYVTVRGSYDHMQEPKIFVTAAAENFIREVLGLEPRALLLKFEAWVINKMNNTQPVVKPRVKTPQAISLCRSIIQKGLEEILKKNAYSLKKKVQMNYDNYEGRIVEVFGVALIGWPCNCDVANPGSIGKENVYKLLNALDNPDAKERCYWVKLSNAELEARKVRNKECAAKGEKVYKARKKPTKKTSAPKSSEMIQSSSSESDDDFHSSGEE
ncbi:hypothetical protein NUW54_g10771 [Trametes sanguinea]|uniref:Uncharacterized protein n=1 Tax=Trametes sanguinea TaxID=158606 RepID=A0ACC1NTN2_9APHY|nr:hypothetical protein NUW54_g10771 [Trametes sanguinea]